MEQKLYTLEEASKILRTTYFFVYFGVTRCRFCKKSKRICTCGKFQSKIRGININHEDSQKAIWRISQEELNRITNQDNK